MGMTVYGRMKNSPSELFDVIRQEIGVKSNCTPFAVKAIEALNSLPSLTEGEAIRAANTFLDNFQTLVQGGIIAEDYDKIDFIKRGKAITISARVEAFLRAAARKGYRITETIVAVPNEDKDTTYFKEQFYNGEIVYVLEDRRFQPDREITAERLTKKYFAKFLCRLEVSDAQKNKRVLMTTCELSNEEILKIASASEQGLFKSRWEKYTDNYGKEKHRKVITSELNTDTFWVKWTSEMVGKTVIRRALKRVREVLPELKDTIYAFENDEKETETTVTELPVIDIPMETVDVDLNHLTAEQKADVKETFDLFKANPKLAQDEANEIKTALEGGAPLNEVVNQHYAAITNIKRSKKLYPIIQKYFEVPNEEK